MSRTAQQIQAESQHTVNLLLLSIVNDGNGSVCGADYGTRCTNAAACEQVKAPAMREMVAKTWLAIACKADKWHRANADDYTPATIFELLAAAGAAASYYADHIKEGK